MFRIGARIAVWNGFKRWCAALLTLVTLPALAAGSMQKQTDGGRDLLVYVPQNLPPSGTRALVVVLHGGLGNAQHIADQTGENGLNMNEVAERYGFLVAYLNGTPVTRFLGADRLGWNAGNCCGQSAAKNIDDVGYIQQTVGHLVQSYGVNPARVYGFGHSNGAMMTQRVMCETSLYAAAVPVSGPLMTAASSCPAAKGKKILAIHGADDENVPIGGGKGKGISQATFSSEEHTRQVFTSSGAEYQLDLVPGADHPIDHINAVIRQTEGITIAEKAARFFGLATTH